MAKDIFLFTEDAADQTEVGGKGFSLIKMANGGFPVPPGLVLGVHFFDDWLARLRGIADLRIRESDSDDVLKAKTAALQDAARRLALAPAQRQQLLERLHALDLPPNQLFSVRSSSPEEDMAGASFAGMYETYLGVPAGDLEARIRDVFVSCIDYRVVAYKRRKGFDITSYAIAVVVMAQIRSEVAGVAFSINPVNNCYDEIVVNANFGVGESVVAGDAVPDTFVVDKVRGTLLSEKIGEKKVSIVIGADGGTKETATPGRETATLTHDQVLELADLVKRVEVYYDMPMDTEWAYADGRFHMLQARPITTYIPLHPDFQTAPGAPKRLYLDLTLIEQGIQKPLSVMGTDCFRILSNEMGLSAAGVPVAEKPGDIVYAAGGRAYVNISAESMLEGQKGAAKEYEGLDAYAAQIIREVDMTPYKGRVTAAGAYKAAKGILTGLFKSADTIAGIIQGSRHPEALRNRIDARGRQFITAIDELDAAGIPFAAFARQSMRMAADFMVHTSIPSLVDAEAAKNGLKKLFAKSLKDPALMDHADRIDRALPHNVTMDMNCRIYELMTVLNASDFASPEALVKKIQDRTLPEAFMAKWDTFIEKYGFRGPREIDIRTPRYAENPSLVIRQMQSYLQLDPENAPAAIMERQAAGRENAYHALHHALKEKKKLEKLYTVLVNLGGYREIHKYYLVYAGNKIRQRALRIARQWTDENRIDAVDDIFYLTPDEVQQAIDDPAADARAAIARHKAYMSIVETIDHFPPVIDSRGKILRPKRRPPREGELVGDPVSAGIVEGNVVVINTVGEKAVADGDILVAKAADPGWTPLFINAAGILLEVGGMLQHGSLIAREYGKPCIAGIEGLTQQLKDGDRVSMDGATGVVSIKSR